MKCFDCKFFSPYPLTTSQQGHCILRGGFHGGNNGCEDGIAKEVNVSRARGRRTEEALKNLKMELACYERQLDYACYLGGARCVKCDFNIKQGTISEHMDALKEAIKRLEETKDDD